MTTSNNPTAATNELNVQEILFSSLSVAGAEEFVRDHEQIKYMRDEADALYAKVNSTRQRIRDLYGNSGHRNSETLAKAERYLAERLGKDRWDALLKLAKSDAKIHAGLKNALVEIVLNVPAWAEQRAKADEEENTARELCVERDDMVEEISSLCVTANGLAKKYGIKPYFIDTNK